MKFLFALMLFTATQAFATDVCSFEDTGTFIEAMEAQGIQPQVSNDHKSFTVLEKKMIHDMTARGLAEDGEGLSMEEALRIFGAYYNGKPGPDAGEIVYYRLGRKTVALVHAWPGENEVGSFYEIHAGSYELIADVGDGTIDCR